MTKLLKWAVGLSFVLIVVGALNIATGIPLHWTKGVVVGSYCESTEEDFLCKSVAGRHSARLEARKSIMSKKS